MNRSHHFSKLLVAGLLSSVPAALSADEPVRIKLSPFERLAQSIPPNPDSVPPIVSPPSRTAEGPIELQQIPRAAGPAPTAPATSPAAPGGSGGEELQVQPLVPAGRPATQEPIAGLDVSAMIDQPLNAAKIISQVDTQPLIPAGELPPAVRCTMDGPACLEWMPSGYVWQSPAFCHGPLYFEQANLERYGIGPCPPWTAPASAAKFAAQAVALPVNMAITPPWECTCTLGHHRPGDCAPIQHQKADHSGQ